MMPYEMLTKDHLKAILSGEKELLKLSEVRFCNAPAYDEIGVKALYDKVIQREGMAKYFPSKYAKGRSCCRDYFYNIWNTVHTEDVREVIAYANQQRYGMRAEKVKEDSVLITEQWMSELDSMPFVSKQKGRMSHLLKQKSKVNAVPKERVTYPAFDFEKRARDVEARLRQQEEEAKRNQQTSNVEGKPKLIKPTVLEKYDEQMKKDGK